MQTIAVCGKGGYGDSTVGILYSALRRYGKVLFVDSARIVSPESAPDFFLWEGESVPHLQEGKGVLLLRAGADFSNARKLPSGFQCVLSSRNPEDAHRLGKLGIPAVACGISGRDTLSIASLDYGNAVLSLQRSVFTLDGTLLEPHDFQVYVQKKVGPSQILPIAMVLLLLGMDSGNGFFLGNEETYKNF